MYFKLLLRVAAEDLIPPDLDGEFKRCEWFEVRGVKGVHRTGVHLRASVASEEFLIEAYKDFRDRVMPRDGQRAEEIIEAVVSHE